MNMDINKIQEELKKIQSSPYAKRTDIQLAAYETLSLLHKCKNRGIQPEALIKYNSHLKRCCKLNSEKVMEIRNKYVPFQYGKQKLAREYGVSTSVIYRIVKRRAWKNFDKSS
jgi:hypothetical protein